MNFLEQLAAEWFEYRGYFVRRNVRVGPRAKGGHDGELDIVAFDPVSRHLVHVEPSMDADPWERREQRFTRKFELGRKHIPDLFKGLDLPPNPDQIALLVFGSDKDRKTLGGGRILLIAEFMKDIRMSLEGKKVAKAAIPEQFVILRSLQFALNYWP